MEALMQEPTTLDALAPVPSLAYHPDPAWPDWFQASQAAAWEEFVVTPMPTRKDEAWRYGNLKGIALDGFVQRQSDIPAESVIAQSQGLAETSAKLVFSNDALVSSTIAALPEGVVVKPLTQAAIEDGTLLRDYFMTHPVELGSHKFATLHKALLRGGVLIYVPKNTELALPIEIFNWVDGDASSVFPHTLVVLGENSRATVVDRFGSLDGKRALACGINDFHLSRGSKLTYVAVQDWSTNSLAFHLNSTVVDRDADATALVVNLGGKLVRGESLSRLAGDGSRSVMLSINPLDGDREVDQRTLQDHAAKHATSDLLYRNALNDKSKTIFSGLIRVEPGNSQTDAYQKVENLMLSPDAISHSMPGLEILNDDVRCTHGATSANIDHDSLFYMQARGIPSELGRRLVVAGFFNSMLDRIDDSTLRNHLGQILATRLGLPF